MTEHMTYILFALMCVTSLAYNIDEYAKTGKLLNAFAIVLNVFVIMYLAVKAATS